jgi:hypothetical protein
MLFLAPLIVFLYLELTKVTRVEFDEKLLLRIPECRYSIENFRGKNSYSEFEMSEMEKYHDLCFQKQIDILKRNGSESEYIKETTRYFSN